MCLKLSPQGVRLFGKVAEHLGGRAWLEKVGHWWVLGLCSLTPLPVDILLSECGCCRSPTSYYSSRDFPLTL